MSWLKRYLLLSLLAEIETFPEVLQPSLPEDHPYIAAMRTVGVPYDPKTWFGEPLTSAMRMACTRATRRMARQGFITRVTEQHRDRITHLVLTWKGLVAALQIAGREADRMRIKSSLEKTHWGRELAQSLVELNETCSVTE